MLLIFLLLLLIIITILLFFLIKLLNTKIKLEQNLKKKHTTLIKYIQSTVYNSENKYSPEIQYIPTTQYIPSVDYIPKYIPTTQFIDNKYIPTTQIVIDLPTSTKQVSIQTNSLDDNSDLLNTSYMCSNCELVNQSQIKISPNALYTNYVGSCSVLVIYHNNLNLLGHIDGMQNNSDQLTKFLKTNLNNINNLNAIILTGPWCGKKCNSINIITDSLKTLNINYSIIKDKIEFNDTIYFDKKIKINK